jgi:Tfp pilus assembly protein PilN
MDTPDHEDRLTILEQAPLLHDATLRRHSDMIERHEERIALLTSLMEQQARTLTTLTEVAARLDTTLQAIRDLLDLGRNGH